MKEVAERVTKIFPEALYTTAEAADYLRVKPETLERWLCTKRFPNFMPVPGGSGRKLYRGSDILAFVATPQEAQAYVPANPRRRIVKPRRVARGRR